MNRALLFGWGGGALLALAAAFPAADAVAELVAARAERARLMAVIADRTPLPPLVEGIRPIGASTLVDALRRRAVRGAVLVEALDASRRSGLSMVDIRISGSEKAVLAFADGVERGPPLARFVTWRLSPVAGGVRLEARAIAP